MKAISVARLLIELAPAVKNSAGVAMPAGSRFPYCEY
jgi:hypothetical protein